MIDALRSLFGIRTPRALPAIPDGQRIYAVGDVHGRLDLFSAIVEAIEADDAERGRADTTVILLGDLVDRGPQSAEVLERARLWQQCRKVRILLGNHEEMFLASQEKTTHLRNFLRYGGRETILSYGVDEATFHVADIDEAMDLMRGAVPADHLAFIQSFEDLVVVGDYLFVHAGIKPQASLEEQERHDLRWIREPFLSHPGDHGMIVVHGHTITDAPEVRRNRIGIDTGAFASGRLTALGLEGTGRWLIEAREQDGVVTTASRPA
jgi:serine/threonine protein phosphatase 1